MAYVFIEHLVGDYETFKAVYLDDAERRRRGGSKGGKVFRSAEDPNDIIIVLEWEDADRAREFANSLELHEAMQWSTSNVATPRVTVLEHAMDSEAGQAHAADRIRGPASEGRTGRHGVGFGMK